MIPLKEFPFVISSTSCEPDAPAEDHRNELAQWLERWLLMRAPPKGRDSTGYPAMAIVFDVDSTLVERTENATDMERIESMHHIYKVCVVHGLSVYAVTARLDCPEGEDELERLLRACRMKRVVRSYLRPDDVPSKSKAIARFKAKCRREIEQQDKVTVAVNVGDNWHDLVEESKDIRQLAQLDPRKGYVFMFPGQKEVSIKLPNL